MIFFTLKLFDGKFLRIFVRIFVSLLNWAPDDRETNDTTLNLPAFRIAMQPKEQIGQQTKHRRKEFEFCNPPPRHGASEAQLG